MENVIARKVTSLTIISILVAGGLTFAVPGAVPEAYAQNENLYVSAENDQFENYFTGPQVIEVIINDEQFRESGFEGSPSVEVDDNTLEMTQADDGNWYAYFADVDMATYADGTTTACGFGLDFGDVDTYEDLAVNNGCMNVVKDSDLIGSIEKIPIAFDGMGITADDYPVVQLFDFVDGSDFDVAYDNGRGVQDVTLIFDTAEDYAGLMLDRAVYPNGAQVQVTIMDTWLDIDPTEDDIWTFTTAAGHEALYYDLFSVENMEQLDSVSFTHDELVDNLMCDDNCVLLLDPDTQGTGNVVTLQNTLDTQRVNGDDGLSSANQQDPSTWSVFFDDEIDPITLIPAGAIPVTVFEDSPGVFITADDDDNSNLIVTDDAKRGTSATIDYNDSATSILIGHGFASIDIALNDETWNSGEVVTVTIDDMDANKNTLVDEAMEISDPLAIIPALSTGSPFTIGDDTSYRVSGLNLGDTDAEPLVTSWPADIGAVAAQVEAHGGEYSSHSVTPASYDKFSAIGIIDMDRSMPVGYLHIDYGRTIADLKNIVMDDEKIFNFFNYDFRSLENADARGISFDEIAASIDDDPDLGTISVDLVTDSCEVNLDTSGSASGYVSLDDDTVMAIHACEEDDEVSVRVSFDTTADAVDRTYMAFAPDTLVSVAADFMSFGYTDDGVQGSERVANQIIRIEAEETDDNTGVFEGALEFVIVNQLNVLDQGTYEIDTAGDAPTFVVIEDLTDEDSPRVSYNDLGADGVVTQVSDQEEAPTHTGMVSFDSNKYKVADTVTITLEDADLNVDSSIIDIYTVVTDHDSTIFGQVGEDLGVEETFGDLGRLLDVTFDDSLWASPDTDDRCQPSGDAGLDDTGFTLIETGTDSGVFTGTFQIPADWCEDGDDNSPQTTTGLDIEVNYLDFRDSSGEIIEVGFSAAVGAHTGSVSLDRTVYPVPFGEPKDFGRDNACDSPSRASYFPVHSTGCDGEDRGLEYIASGDLTIHVRVADPDFDTSAAGQDSIAVAVEDTKYTGPVKISVIRGSETVTLGFAGGPIAKDNYIYEGIPTMSQYDDDGNHVRGTSDNVRQFGPMQEIAGDAGVFEADIVVRYTDGPMDSTCPLTSVYSELDGSDSDDAAADRFGPDSISGPFCILQGDILQVEYNDPIDSSGDPNTVTDSATFDLRNAVLQSDKSEYLIGTDMILTLIEPDFDLDNDQAETYDLDLIEWDSDAATITMGDRGGNAAAFDPEPTAFRETGDSTGIFQTIIEIPEELDGDQLVRGEAITMEYTDWGPAGADFVGQEDEDVTLDIMTSDFGATIELDQKVYTWTDKVYITIVAPDHNYDSDLIDEIGDTSDDELKISTRGHDLNQYKLVETGTDTGIFTGEVILSGFAAHDADGDGDASDARGITGDGTGRSTGIGPTNGYLETSNDDGLSVSFEYSDDVTIISSALIRWNIGEVQWLESSYPATGTGVVRVIDPDMNLNPEAVDNFDVNVWSDTDAGGIDLTVTETNEATGIFEGTVAFSTGTESSGHRLRVDEGDTVTAEYEDRTLPDPYSMRDDLDVTATTLIGTSVPPLERAPASNLRVVDSFGNSLDTVSVDQQVQITADLMNGQDRDQAFAYLVQVQDANGVVVSLAWITGSLTPEQSFSPAESWTPSAPGMYTATAFVWESLDNPTALSPPVSLDITVQ